MFCFFFSENAKEKAKFIITIFMRFFPSWTLDHLEIFMGLALQGGLYHCTHLTNEGNRDKEKLKDLTGPFGKSGAESRTEP